MNLKLFSYNGHEANQDCDLPPKRIKNSDKFGVEDTNPTPINLIIYLEPHIKKY